MVDPALVYTAGVLVLFFFWVYGIVAFLRDTKNYLIPWYRQYRGTEPRRRGRGGQVADSTEEPPARADGTTDRVRPPSVRTDGIIGRPEGGEDVPERTGHTRQGDRQPSSRE